MEQMHHVAKVRVASSNLVIRSIEPWSDSVWPGVLAFRLPTVPTTMLTDRFAPPGRRSTWTDA